MMFIHHIIRAAHGAVLLALALPVSAFAADEAKRTFDILFASKLKAASMSADVVDDIAVAREMIALARTTGEQPALVVHLCESAYDLCIRTPEGFSVAAEAMALLSDTIAEKRLAAREKHIAVLTRQAAVGKPDDREAAGWALIELLTDIGNEKLEKKQYADAAVDFRRALAFAQQKQPSSVDELKPRLEFALARERAMKRVLRLQERLLGDANDSATAEEIVKIFVIEFDDPEAAVPFLNRVNDAELKSLVSLSVAPAASLDAAATMKVALWCRSLADQVGSADLKAPLLHRAKSHLLRFLSLQTDGGIEVTKAGVLLGQVNAQLNSHRSKPPRGTLAYFSFDKATIVTQGPQVSFKDGSTGGSSARNVGARLSDAGKFGECLEFNGGHLEVTLKGLPPQIKELTIAAWVRSDRRANQTVIDNHHWEVRPTGFVLRMTDHKPNFTVGTGEWIRAGGGELEPGRWTFLAGALDTRTIRFYVDGQEVSSHPIKGPVNVGPRITLGNGHFKEAKDRPFHGAMDDVWFIGRALGPREIKALYER